MIRRDASAPTFEIGSKERYVLGDPADFAVAYSFLDTEHVTELALYVNGVNLLGFTHGCAHLTTRWNLDDLVLWLHAFVADMREDPCPVEVPGRYAAQKDSVARENAPKISEGCTDEELQILDDYIDRLEPWEGRHAWISRRGGSILSNLFFEYREGRVEISWDNRCYEPEVEFDCLLGGDSVNAETFTAVMSAFVDAYAEHWGVSLA